MFLLVPAYPGCPGSKAVKRSLLLLLFATNTGKKTEENKKDLYTSTDNVWMTQKSHDLEKRLKIKTSKTKNNSVFLAFK